MNRHPFKPLLAILIVILLAPTVYTSSPGTKHAASKVEAQVRDSDELPTLAKNRQTAVAGQIAFIIQLMGQIVSFLRFATGSNVTANVIENMNRAVEALGQLAEQATRLIDMISERDRGVVRIVLERWVSALRVLRITLQGYITNQANNVAQLRGSAQGILNELTRGFWTRAQVALNGYAAFGRFTQDWAPWVEAIGQYFQGN